VSRCALPTLRAGPLHPDPVSSPRPRARPTRRGLLTRGHFPTDDAALKILYLAIRNIGSTRGGEIGTHTQGSKRALNAFAIAFPGRLTL
jgi:putative transposase